MLGIIPLIINTEAALSYNLTFKPNELPQAPEIVMKGLCKEFIENYVPLCVCNPLFGVMILDVDCDVDIDDEVVEEFADAYNLIWADDYDMDEDLEPNPIAIMDTKPHPVNLNEVDLEHVAQSGGSLGIPSDDTAIPELAPLDYVHLRHMESPELFWRHVIWPVDMMDGKRDGMLTADFFGEGVHIFVLDTGYHREFKENSYFPHGAHFAPDDEHWSVQDNTGEGPFFDCHGHGTAVATYAGGAYMSAAPHTIIHIVRIAKCLCDTPGCGRVSSSRTDTFRAVDWVVGLCKSKKYQRAIIVRSFSTAPPDDSNYAMYSLAANKAEEANILWVGSAGNVNESRCVKEVCKGKHGCPVRSDYTKPIYDDLALIVGSVNVDGTKSSFSNWGSCVNMYMYGHKIPGIPSPAEGLRAFQPPRKQYYNSGTSFSAPLAAGIAAMILHRNGATRPQITKSLVIQTIRYNEARHISFNLSTVNVEKYIGYSSGYRRPNFFIALLLASCLLF